MGAGKRLGALAVGGDPRLLHAGEQSRPVPRGTALARPRAVRVSPGGRDATRGRPMVIAPACSAAHPYGRKRGAHGDDRVPTIRHLRSSSTTPRSIRRTIRKPTTAKKIAPPPAMSPYVPIAFAAALPTK